MLQRPLFHKINEREFALVVSRSVLGHPILYHCYNSCEVEYKNLNCEIGDWFFIDHGDFQKVVPPLNTSVYQANGLEIVVVETPAIYFGVTRLSAEFRGIDIKNYLYSPFMGKIAIGCGMDDKLRTGKLYNVTAVWFPGSSPLLNFLRDYEQCHFVVQNNGLEWIKSPRDHFYLNITTYINMTVEAVSGCIALCRSPLLDRPVMVYLTTEFVTLGQIVQVLLIRVRVEPDYPVYIGKEAKNFKENLSNFIVPDPPPPLIMTIAEYERTQAQHQNTTIIDPFMDDAFDDNESSFSRENFRIHRRLCRS